MGEELEKERNDNNELDNKNREMSENLSILEKRKRFIE